MWLAWCLHAPIAHHLVPLCRIDLNVGVVHEAVDTNAGAEEAGKGEADLKGKGRRVGEPVLLGVGTSHGRSLIYFGRGNKER